MTKRYFQVMNVKVKDYILLPIKFPYVKRVYIRIKYLYMSDINYFSLLTPKF